MHRFICTSNKGTRTRFKHSKDYFTIVSDLDSYFGFFNALSKFDSQIHELHV